MEQHPIFPFATESGHSPTMPLVAIVVSPSRRAILERAKGGVRSQHHLLRFGDIGYSTSTWWLPRAGQESRRCPGHQRLGTRSGNYYTTGNCQ
jgi:hypothetical protein